MAKQLKYLIWLLTLGFLVPQQRGTNGEEKATPRPDIGRKGIN